MTYEYSVTCHVYLAGTISMPSTGFDMNIAVVQTTEDSYAAGQSAINALRTIFTTQDIFITNIVLTIKHKG